MRRACKVTLKFATAKKQRQIAALLQAYRVAVNFYIKSLWTSKGKRDASTLARLVNTRLSERYKQAALKQAFDLMITTKRSAKALRKRCSVPVFKGKAILDYRFISAEKGRGSFDLVLKLATLRKGHPVYIPTKHTAMTRKWLAKPDARLVRGCALAEDSLTLWVELPDLPCKTEGKALGIDLGVNKLISDSDGKHYGGEFKTLSAKIRRKRPGSKGKRRALTERDNYINRVVKELPWQELKAIGYEDLRGIKHGKRRDRNKDFRKAMAPWVVRRVVNRVEQMASENRVRQVKVSPTYTSQRCPSCGLVSKANRRGEHFQCVRCNYKADADSVGALNGLARTLETLGSLYSPSLKKEVS